MRGIRAIGRMILALCAMLILCMGGARAEKYALMRGNAGYGGVIIGGAMVPLEITVKATDEAIDGVVGVKVYARDGKMDIIEQPVFVEGGQSTTIRMCVRPSAPQSGFAVELTDENGAKIAKTTLYASRVIEAHYGNVVTGVLGTQALCDALAARIRDEDRGYEEIQPVLLDAETFMRVEDEMSAWGLLVIDDFDVRELTQEQQEMIVRFVQDGGIVLLGAGTAEVSSLSWFGELTGVQVGERTQTDGLVAALVRDAGVRDDGAARQSVNAAALTGGEPLVRVAGDAPQGDGDGAQGETAGEKAVMTASRVGEGIVITCGFSLSDPVILDVAGEYALWHRVLMMTDADLFRALTDRQYRGVAQQMGSYTNEQVLVPTDRSLAPVAAMLGAYAVIVGLGLYALARKRDRSTWLWAIIPLTAVLFTGAVAAMGGALGLNRPIAVSTRLTKIDEENNVSSEEVVSLAYAGQERVRLSGADGEVLRYAADSYEAYDDTPEYKRELRNVVRMDDAPFIELEGMATWISRFLRVESKAMPEGGIDASAWFEVDGLHISIENGLDVDLENAVVLTNYGYKRLGDIASGEQITASLIRSEGWRTGDNHNILIDEGELAMCNLGIGLVIDFAVYPERAQQLELDLDQDEAYRRSMEDRRLSLGGRYTSKVIECVLVADAPQLPCATLLADGRAITRTQHTSVLVKAIRVDTAGEIGHPFIPAGEIKAISCAVGEDGAPVMKETAATVGLGRGCFGYTIDRIRPENITRITFSHAHWDMVAEVYDHVRGDWVQLGDGELTIIEDVPASGFVSEAGEIFLRYSAPTEISVDENAAFSAPGIIVEGRNDA